MFEGVPVDTFGSRGWECVSAYGAFGWVSVVRSLPVVFSGVEWSCGASSRAGEPIMPEMAYVAEVAP